MSIYDGMSFEEAWKKYGKSKKSDNNSYIEITTQDIEDSWVKFDESNYIVGIDTVTTFNNSKSVVTNIQNPTVVYHVLSERQKRYLDFIVSNYEHSIPPGLLQLVKNTLIEDRYKSSDKDRLNTLRLYVNLKKFSTALTEVRQKYKNNN